MRMGLPKVTSDEGGEFKSNLEKEIMELLKIKRHYITPYHPQVNYHVSAIGCNIIHFLILAQANGLDERWNQTLKQMIVKFTNSRKDQWDEFLDTSVFAYNSAKHESTQYSPFELMFGRKAVIPVDLDFESKDGQHLLTEYQKSSVNLLCYYNS